MMFSKLPRILVLMALALGGLALLAGCSDDEPVAPQDEDPPVTEQAAKNQSYLLAYTMSRILPEFLSNPKMQLLTPEEEFVSDPDIDGSFWLDDDVEPAHAYTDDTHKITYEPPDFFDTIFALEFDIFAAMAGNPNIANGTGTLTAAGSTWVLGFEVDDVAFLDAGGFPIGGQLIVTIDVHTVVIDFTPPATLTIGSAVFPIDLDDFDLP